ncbi:efflux transporter outer membrane subunit [Halarcobacter ebronensis]|uniref:Transporter n=1 Tax=Halarcobacter ebronensis TaxID=1462615 RepID=A0A4V1M0W2_9BACT|nr:efflux transporter outer membrane subunit [Halarcobacter ebronensis]QKF80747.1 RND family efflux system, outer membrane channel protein, TolC family [Halarcobacter ebronensis]RXK08540.1 transporter [Halarcobacter ebronensis]
MKTNKIVHISLSLSFAVLFNACSMIDSQYQQPTAPVPKAWPKGEAYKSLLEIQNSEPLSWEEMILDEKLKKVIKIALTQNRSLKEEIANIESARATYRVQHAAEFPAINAEASGSKAKTNTGNISESYQATLGLSSFELDLFGKARNLSKADFESFLSAKEAQRVTRITIIAEVANAWLTMASDKSLLEFAKKTAQSSKKSLELVEARIKHGVDSKATLYDAQTVYYKALADIEAYKTQVAQDLNALNLLVGETLSEDLLPESLDENREYLANIPVNLTSNILLNRPDILEAEHSLKAANANISVARAAYFPTISITSAIGVASNALKDLFTGGTSHIWSFAPNVTLPIFDWNSRGASLDYAKAQRDLYVAKYELAIQTAFSEVSDALAREGTIDEQLKAEENLVLAAKNSFFLSEKRYKLGIDTYLDALTSQRTLYSAQQSLISLRLTKINNRVTLYRVLAVED